MSTIRVNPLANPKGAKLRCELCQSPAHSQCQQCRVTYYCCRDHQAADWDGIHEKVCDLLRILRASKPFLSSQVERTRYHDEQLFRQKHLLQLTTMEAQKLLYEGRHQLALPAARLSLRTAIDIYGTTSVHLVPSYLMLGEASIGTDKLNQAEEYLMQAQWTVVKLVDCPPEIRSRLNRNLGLLFIAKQEYNKALKHLSEDVFHASVTFGPEHLRTAGGYFYMARVFQLQQQMDVALPLYEEVVSIWHRFMVNGIAQCQAAAKPSSHPLTASLRAQTNPSITGIAQQLDAAQQAEAKVMLQHIYNVYEDMQAPADEKKQLHCIHTLAMLYGILNLTDKAKHYTQQAQSLCDQLQPDESERMAQLTQLTNLLQVDP